MAVEDVEKIYFHEADLNGLQFEQDDNDEDTAFHLCFCENWIHKI